MMRLFPPAHDGPRYEIQSIGRELDDLSPAEKVAPRPGGVARPLAYVALALLALVAFFTAMLLTPPLGH
jgi:hypothetical protein